MSRSRAAGLLVLGMGKQRATRLEEPWWTHWWTVWALAVVLVVALIAQVKEWDLLAGTATAVAAILGPLRDAAVKKRAKTIAGAVSEARAETRTQTVDAARRALTQSDPYIYFRDMCIEVERVFSGRPVRVGIYVLEPTTTDEDQSENYLLSLYGQNDCRRQMSATVDPSDPRGSHSMMVDRALKGIPLVVPDVTQRKKFWENPLPNDDDQRDKYMSFISIPIARWPGQTSPVAGSPPAGLLCVDSQQVDGLTEADEDMVRSLAHMAGIGLNALWGGRRPHKPRLPASSRFQSGGSTVSYVIRSREER